VSSILSGKYELLRTAAEDRLHQPHRAKLVKGFYRVLEEGYRAGAWAVFLSGAGPAVCALTAKEKEEEVGEALREGFKKEGVEAKILKLLQEQESCSRTEPQE